MLGVRRVPLLGIALAATGLVLLGTIPTHGTYLADLLPGLMLVSIGMGLTFVPLTLIATTNIHPEDAGLASGIFNTSQQVGGAIGLAALSTLAASRTSHVLGGIANPSSDRHAAALVDGFQAAFLAGAGLMVLAAVLVAVLVRKSDVEQIHAAEESEPVPVAA